MVGIILFFIPLSQFVFILIQNVTQSDEKDKMIDHAAMHDLSLYIFCNTCFFIPNNLHFLKD